MALRSHLQEPIGVAIAGLGFGESVHLPALRSVEGLEPVALWHPRKEKLEIACKNNELTGYQDWEQLLNNPKIEAVIIATPPEPRFELAKTALNAGKHLLMEKPVALNADQVKELQKLAIQEHLSVAVDFEYRAVPIFMQAQRILSQGLLGEPWLVKLDWLMSSRANPSRPWNWYSNSEAGGGVIGALGTHAFDMIHWLCGPSRKVNAMLSTSIKERLDEDSGSQKEVNSEDVALMHLEVQNQKTNHLLPTQITLSAVSKEGRGCWIEIYGSEGSLILGSNNQKDYVHGFGLSASSSGQPLQNIRPDKDLAFSTTWNDGRIAPVARIQDWWGESIRSGKPMVPGLLEGWASQQVSDKAKQSAATGKSMQIN